MDIRQRTVFAVIFGLSFVLSIVLKYVIISLYQFEIFHLVLVFGAIQLVFNPQGLRLLFFLFFSYLLINVFSLRYDQSYFSYNPERLMFGFPMYMIGLSARTMVYAHVFLYAALALFSFKNPFKRKEQLDSEVIDHFHDME